MIQTVYIWHSVISVCVCKCLTLAGIGVVSLCRPPGQVVVEVLTVLTVQTLCVVVTHAVTMDLDTHTHAHREREKHSY